MTPNAVSQEAVVGFVGFIGIYPVLLWKPAGVARCYGHSSDKVSPRQCVDQYWEELRYRGIEYFNARGIHFTSINRNKI